jgi:hypothetical protein
MIGIPWANSGEIVKPDRNFVISLCGSSQFPVLTAVEIERANSYNKQNKLRGFSQRENYTDREIAACLRS